MQTLTYQSDIAILYMVNVHLNRNSKVGKLYLDFATSWLGTTYALGHWVKLSMIKLWWLSTNYSEAYYKFPTAHPVIL